MKRFCTTGLCVPGKHYMVDISARIKKIMAMVERRDYFVINRGRQYGKTTTLNELSKALNSQGYQVIKLDFQDIGADCYATESEFTIAFARMLKDAQDFDGLSLPEKLSDILVQLAKPVSNEVRLDDLMRFFRRMFLFF